MAQILVRNLDEHVKAGLARRAARHGRSLEAEARAILAEAVAPPEQGLGTRIAQRFAGIGLDEPIEEWRGEVVRRVDFGD
jgi:plasmid stability protein